MSSVRRMVFFSPRGRISSFLIGAQPPTVREISYLTLQKNVVFLASGPKEVLVVFSPSTLFKLLKVNFPDD
jgi:hypothetical protein